MKKVSKPKPISVQVKEKNEEELEPIPESKGNFDHVISTGSTLLDLAISAGRIHGGGIPSGVFVEISGPESSGKTVLLCEIAGDVRRKGGSILFKDTEGRLDWQFAQLFGLHMQDKDYTQPDTVTELFRSVRAWKPEGPGVHGIFADSLAALSTELEMETEEGDKMGSRQAKEFSQELRRTCRELPKKNYIMVCSNQLREKISTSKIPLPASKKEDSPGGKAIRFYSSLRLRTSSPKDIVREIDINGKKVSKVVGIEVMIKVIKSSVWHPFETAPITIIFDYGIDDIRQNLQYIKDKSGLPVYTLRGQKLYQSMEKSIKAIEDNKLENALKEEVITRWEEEFSKFKSDRKPKR